MSVQRDAVLLALGLTAGMGMHALYIMWNHSKRNREMPKSPKSENDIIVPYKELENFCCSCLVAAGCSEKNAKIAAEVLIAADLRGISSHGIQRLYLYCNEIKTGTVDGKGSPRVIELNGGNTIKNLVCHTVDGNNCQGAVVSTFATDLAVGIARKHGCSVVVAKNSNHYGIAGYYTDYVAREHGMLCLCMTNTSALTVPTHAREACLGTNPISFAAPTSTAPSNSSSNPILIDMATTTVPLGRIEIFKAENNHTLPSSNWAVDSMGKPCRDPTEIIDNGGCMLPLGGATELDGGHKGYCAALMVELLCGVLSGSESFGKTIGDAMNPRAINKSVGGQISHCFLVVDPSAFNGSNCVSSYQQRATMLSEQLRTLERVTPNKRVRVPGDRSSDEMKCRQNDGIPIPRPIAKMLFALSLEYSVSIPKVLQSVLNSNSEGNI